MAFNIRGNDIAYNPVALSYVLITPDEIRWYVNEKSVPADLKERLSTEKSLFTDMNRFMRI